jgi:hypothetical protein
MKQEEDWLAVDRAAEYAFEAFMDGASDEEIERWRRMQRKVGDVA